MSEDKVPIYISRALYDKIKDRVKESEGEFRDVEDYVTFVLEEVTKEEEAEEIYTPEEEEEIKKRLRSLGYL